MDSFWADVYHAGAVSLMARFESSFSKALVIVVGIIRCDLLDTCGPHCLQLNSWKSGLLETNIAHCA